jgi:FMN-dependent NADH-azoreductase
MRKKESHSRYWGNELIAKITRHDSVVVHDRDLATGVKQIDDAWIQANSTKENERTEQQRAVLFESDQLINELKLADTLVIGLPIYNFGVPAAFKAWIDLVTRQGKTFAYSASGPLGLLSCEHAYVVLSSGGTALGSDIDFVSPWLVHILGFIGITQVTILDGSGHMRDEEETSRRLREQLDNLKV